MKGSGVVRGCQERTVSMRDTLYVKKDEHKYCRKNSIHQKTDKVSKPCGHLSCRTSRSPSPPP